LRIFERNLSKGHQSQIFDILGESTKVNSIFFNGLGLKVIGFFSVASSESTVEPFLVLNSGEPFPQSLLH